ncbi:MAG: methyltransferase type 12 [Rhizorhabdus sp.]|nr:methyltransferase type 12 [Rhizorhabdus sp.]
MDAADLDPAVYARVLSDLASVNRLTMAARPTIGFVKRAIGDRRAFSLLDVGFGDGDMLRAIARWAEKRQIAATLIGVDLNPHSAPVARDATPDRFGIDYRTGDYRDHLDPAPDLIVSSLVTHHMSVDQRTAFLRDMHRQAQIGWHVNDLHRHPFPYLGFPLLARLMGWHRIVREDGQLSIARSFQPDEWHADIATAGIDPTAIRVARRFPFRLCVEHIR